jgi:hypothetical protein
VLKAADSGVACMAVNPESISVDSAVGKSGIAEVENSDVFESVIESQTPPVVVQPPAAPDSHTPPVVVHTTTSSDRVPHVPNRTKGAKVIDFDFDSIPVESIQQSMGAPSYVHPAVSHASHETCQLPSRSLSSEHIFGTSRPATSSPLVSPSVSEIRDKGIELVKQGLQYGKEWYSTLMNR